MQVCARLDIVETTQGSVTRVFASGFGLLRKTDIASSSKVSNACFREHCLTAAEGRLLLHATLDCDLPGVTVCTVPSVGRLLLHATLDCDFV